MFFIVIFEISTVEFVNVKNAHVKPKKLSLRPKYLLLGKIQAIIFKKLLPYLKIAFLNFQNFKVSCKSENS